MMMREFLKIFLQKKFWIALIISILLFQGIETFLEEIFGLSLDHYLALGGGVGFVVIYGFKFHILCCLIPTLMATLVCLKQGKYRCSDCHHTPDEEKVDQ